MVKRKLTDRDILSLHDLYNSGLSSCAISKKFNTCHSNITYHLKKLGIERRNRSSAAKEGVKAGRIIIKRNKIPENLKLNGDLAYILGVLCGDGYIDYSNERKTYHIALSATDKEFVDRFREVLINFFKIKPTTEFRKSRNKNWSDQHVTRLCSKEACDFINEICNFGKFEWRVPEIIKNSNNNIKYAFVRGFFDSEGEIDKKSRRIGATSANFKGLKEIADLLKDLGTRYTISSIKDTRPNTHQKYRLRLQDRKSIEIFNRNIKFTIRRKQKILDYLVNNYKFTKILPEELDKLRERVLILKKFGLNYTKIANKLNMNLTTVWNICKSYNVSER